LLEDPSARAEAAKKMALREEVSSNQTLLHRLIVAIDGSPTAFAELVSKLPEQSAGGILQKISECLQADRKTLYAKIALDLEAKAAVYRSKI
jgi:glycine cleavage system regulatory protein